MLTSARLAGLDVARPGPDQTIDCHGTFPHGNAEKCNALLSPPENLLKLLF